MVRKISIAVLCVCMCFVLCVSASAASVYLPVPPETESSCIYVYRLSVNGLVYLNTMDQQLVMNPDTSTYVHNSTKVYVLNADTNSWDIKHPDGSRGHIPADTEFLYDSNGVLASDSLKIFGISVPVSSEDWESVFNNLKGQISVETVVAILFVGSGMAVGLVFIWWGVRKLVRVLMTAFKKGKIQL